MEITDEELAKFIEEDWSFMVQPVEDIRHEAAKRIRELATLRTHSAQALLDWAYRNVGTRLYRELDAALKRFAEQPPT